METLDRRVLFLSYQRAGEPLGHKLVRQASTCRIRRVSPPRFTLTVRMYTYRRVSVTQRAAISNGPASKRAIKRAARKKPQ